MNVDKIKPWLDIADLAFKLSVAVIGFLLFGVEKQRLDVESTRNKILKDQQELNLVVPDKIITLLFDARNKCIAEDQAFMLDFLDRKSVV